MRGARRLPAVLFLLLLAALGYGMLWTTFMVYDDEGYVLYSLRTFHEVGGLYEKVFSQYGPFFFLWNRGLAFLGFDFSNTGARVVTLAYWLIATTACGALVMRATRSAVAMIAAMGAVFLHLWSMASEPSHPGGFICAIVALVAWIGGQDTIAAHRRALVIGAAGAALVLTKINVGIFLLAGATTWWAISSAPCSTDRWRTGAVAAVVALPLLVMHQLLAQQWVIFFAIITGTAAAGVVLATPRPSRPVPLSALGVGIGAGVVIVIVTLVFVRATGTSWSGLVDGVILGPLRHPGAYSAPVRWRPGAALVAVISLAAILWVQRRPAARRFGLVASVRSLVAAIYLLCWSSILPLDLHAFTMSYGLAALPWFVLPIGEDDAQAGLRSWLGLLTATQALHAFPVAGSQISWGTFLWLPLAAIAAHDAWRVASERAGRTARLLLQWGAPACVLAVVVGHTVRFGSLIAARFQNSDALALPGASAIYLPPNFSSTLRVLSLNASVHADVLFSIPGMLSFHGWTGVPPPTTLNATHWFTLLQPDQQEEIRERLAPSPRACLIVQREVYEFLVRTKVATESPLMRWLHENFERVLELDTYEFWVRRDRAVALLGTAQVRATDQPGMDRYRMEALLAAPDANGIASVTLEEFTMHGVEMRQRWDASNARIQLARISSAGVPFFQPRAVTWPFNANQLMRVELFTDEFPAPLHAPFSAIVRFRDASGKIVAEARLRD